MMCYFCGDLISIAQKIYAICYKKYLGICKKIRYLTATNFNDTFIGNRLKR